jgi:hypothetical protein
MYSNDHKTLMAQPGAVSLGKHSSFSPIWLNQGP